MKSFNASGFDDMEKPSSAMPPVQGR